MEKEIKKMRILIISLLFFVGCSSSPDFKDTKKRIEAAQEDSKTYRKKVQESSCSIAEKKDFESGLDRLDKNLQKIQEDTSKNSELSEKMEEKLESLREENFWLWMYVIGQIVLIILYYVIKFYVKSAMPGAGQALGFIQKYQNYIPNSRS